MTVTVNGEPGDLPDPPTVATVVASLGATGNGCAVAVNEEIVPRREWGERRIRPGDRVEVLTAVQGG